MFLYSADEDAREQLDLELQILEPQNRITATQLDLELKKSSSDSNRNQRHLLIDVRSEAEFNMCRIDGAVNYPIEHFRDAKLGEVLKMIAEEFQVTFVCRRGNDSQIAAQMVLDRIDEDHKGKVKDLVGGLHSWSATVDHDFPVY